MCSVQDTEDIVPVVRHEGVSRNCMKCSEAATIVIRVNDPLCRECFLSYCVHKFRMSFGKSKLIRDKEHVLLAFSGGSCSSGMLHLVKEGKSERAKKKLRFVPLLVHIDESTVVPGASLEEEKVLMKMRNTGLQYQVYRLEQVFDSTLRPIEGNIPVKTEAASADSLRERFEAAALDPQDTQNHAKLDCQSSGDATDLELQDTQHTANLDSQGTQSIGMNLQHTENASNVDSQGELDSPSEEKDTAKQSLLQLLSSAKTLSAKQALLLNFRLHLLARVAVAVGVNKVLLGDSGTRLAIRMLSDITQGRGAHLSFEMSFADIRRADVTYVRPMREFTNKEVAMYNVLNKVDPLFIPNLSTKAGNNSSIEQLTEQFVTGLQADFPNTVSTIFRTGEKLDLSDKRQSTDEDRKCSMCQAPLDTDVPQCSALNATLFSQSLCSPKPSVSAERGPSRPSCTSSTSDTGGVWSLQSESEAGTSCCGNGDGSCHTLNTS